MFQVGDKVVWDDKEYAAKHYKESMSLVMTISEVEDGAFGNPYVYMQECDNDGLIIQAYAYRFKLYEEEKKGMLYSIGDKVVIVDNLYFHEFNIGEVVTIASLDEHTQDYKAVCTKGKSWYVKDDEITPYVESTNKIKSDGGSSSYYDVEIPGWLADKLLTRIEDKKPFLKTEELIMMLFNNDFDFGNIQKSLVRAYQATRGGGKDGNDVDYDMNKIIYSANKIKEYSKYDHS